MISGVENIKKFLPQREPMIMVDTLLGHVDGATKSSFLIAEDNVFVSQNRFTEAGLLENMAQTAALGKGFECSEKNENPPLGFIGAVKGLYINRLPKVNDIIETQITPKHEVLNASIVDATVSLNGEMIAGCELKIFINPQINES